MRPGHIFQGQRLAIFAEAGAVARVVAEAVLDTDDDPVALVRTCFGGKAARGRGGGSRQSSASHHRLVNTTPKPRATKKRRGELPLSLFLLFWKLWSPEPLPWELVAEGPEVELVVSVAARMATRVASRKASVMTAMVAGATVGRSTTVAVNEKKGNKRISRD